MFIYSCILRYRTVFMNKKIEEAEMLEVNKRLQRVVMIVKLLADQVFFNSFISFPILKRLIVMQMQAKKTPDFL